MEQRGNRQAIKRASYPRHSFINARREGEKNVGCEPTSILDRKGGEEGTKSMQTSSGPLVPSTVSEEPFDSREKQYSFVFGTINDCRA